MLIQIRMLIVTVPLLAAGTAWAEPASNSSPLESIMPKGGFFDAFSRKSPIKEATIDRSGTPASNTSYWTDTQGGGLFGFAAVEAAERCATKACNLYYGDAPPDESEQSPPATSQAFADITPVVPEAEPPAVRDRQTLAQRASSCAPDLHDPWRCYR